MKISKGTKLTVTDSRNGQYKAVASFDFDTDIDEWYSVVVDQRKMIKGAVNCWYNGDSIPCRRGIATVSIRE